MRNTSPRAGNVSVRQFGRISRLHGLAIVVALLLPAAFPGAASAVTSWSRSGSASLSNSGSTSVSLTGQDLSGDYENTSFSGTVNCPGINGGTGFVSASGSLAPGSIPAYTDESAVAEDASSAHVTMAGYSTACGPWPGDYYQVQIQLAATTRRMIEEFMTRPRSGAHPEALASLTEREGEVLRLIALGLSNAEIGEQLFVSPATAKTHVARILSKLELRDRVQAVVLAYETGLVQPGSD